MRSNILKIFFIAWVTLWALFFARELFIKNNARDYKALISRSLDGKHSYVMGDKAYEFIKYCTDNMSDRATYKMVGIEGGDLVKRQAVYYLYPRLESIDPDYVIDMAQYKLNKVK